jgi:hypothetical protein
VMSDFGLNQFCQSIETLDLKQLELQLTELLKNKDHYQAIIRQNLNAIQLSMKRHEQELLSKIL